jgi:hypothetical protein
VPGIVASRLRLERHQAWTAFEANLGDADDRDLVAYAHDKRAMLVTTNRSCAISARRARTARTIWLQVDEQDAEGAMLRAVEWLDSKKLPSGRVLRVQKTGKPEVVPLLD